MSTREPTDTKSSSRAAIVILALSCATTSGWAQSTPIVTITPTTQVILGTTTVNVTIDWCGKAPNGTLDVSTRLIRLNSVNITSQFTTEWNYFNFDCNGPDDHSERSTGTITINQGANTFDAQIYNFAGYLGADNETYHTPITTPNGLGLVLVAAEGQYVQASPSTATSRRFSIQNLRAVRDTFTASVTCTVVTSCSVTPTSVALNAGQSAWVTANFTAGSNGTTGLVWVKAVKGASRDSAWMEVKAATAPAAGVVAFGTGTTVERSLCLTLPAGPEASVECGDLRLSHTLPAVRTLGTARAPTLLYSAQHAHPYPLLAADVTLAGGALPTTVQAILSINGQQHTRSWTGTDWGSGGQTRRIVVGFDALSYPTGLYPYTLEISRITGSTVTVLQTLTGTLPIVNYSASTFGAGWWLAGVERLLVANLMWVGGDGSVRQYQSAGTDVWVAAQVTRPDTLKRTPATGEYTRYLRHGARVVFDAQGRHVRTVDRLGYTTTFTYDTCSRLSTITPPPGAAAGVYQFTYSSPTTCTALLTGVTAPGNRVTSVATTSNSRITRFLEPTLDSVRFAYSGTSRRVQTRYDRRNLTSVYAYNTAGLVTSHVRTAIGTDTHRPAQSFGLGGTEAAQPLDSVYTRFDGPRTDVADVARFWVNPYGAPLRIRNPLGRETRLTYVTAWPGLVASTETPSRLLTRAWYHSTRALLDSTIEYAPLGGSTNGKTTYAWNTTWHFPTEIRTAALDTVKFSYDGTNGNRVWMQPGGSSARRVNFDYDATTKLLRAIRVPNVATPESLFYSTTLLNVNRTKSPIGFLTLRYQDALGRDTLVVTPRDSAQSLTDANLLTYGVRNRIIYDGLGRVKETAQKSPSFTIPGISGNRTLPAESLRVVHTYDPESNVTFTARHYTVPGVSPPAPLTSGWTYDNANRVLTHTEPGRGAIAYTRDPAGNATSTGTPRGFVMSSQYDAAGQLIRTILPQVTYTTIPCPLYGSCALFSFPTRDGSTVCLPADTAYFGYDVLGNPIRADNAYGRVRRTYFPNGLLASDTLRIRTYYTSAPGACGGGAPAGQSGPAPNADFNAHVYILRYEYDLDGRRLTVYHPDGIDICSGSCRTRYQYLKGTGWLDRVLDLLDSATVYTYDNAGRVTSVRHPGNIINNRVYDNDSRVRQRTGTLFNDLLGFDARGLARSGTVGDQYGSRSIQLAYAGLGATAYGQNLTLGSGTSEEFETDALGNRRWQRDYGVTASFLDRRRRLTYDASARVTQINVEPPTPTYYQYQHNTAYDASGNVFKAYGYESESQSGQWTRIDDQAIHYYGPGEQLRVFNRHMGLGTVSAAGGVFEEYRYDALGRRVLTRSRVTASCGAPCPAYIERTVWDGDQVLWEIRAVGGDGALHSTMESDNPTGTLHGLVGYAHGPGVDQPVVVYRRNLDGQPSPLAVAPHGDWRGEWANGTLVNYAPGTQTVGCNNSYGCPVIAWPGGQVSVDGELAGSGFAPSWWGSLVGRRSDGSRLQYLRNRYYDPETGRFTQEDPIGLAGGLNLYGFANGDPVNFSDPFGLCIPWCTALAGAGAFGIVRIGANIIQDRPWYENVARDVVLGTVAGATLGAATPAIVTTLSGGGSSPALGTAVAGTVAQKLSPAEVDRLREFFGRGLQGAQARASSFGIPDGLSRETLLRYQEIARQAIEAGRDKLGVQAARLRLIDRALRELNDQ